MERLMLKQFFDEKVPAGSLEIEIFRADHTAYSKKIRQSSNDE